MTLKVTYHVNAQADPDRWSQADIIPPQFGERVDLTVSGTHDPADAVTQRLYARLLPDGEDCVVAWGIDAVAVATVGFPLKDGVPEWIYLQPGERISVIAAT